MHIWQTQLPENDTDVPKHVGLVIAYMVMFVICVFVLCYK